MGKHDNQSPHLLFSLLKHMTSLSILCVDQFMMYTQTVSRLVIVHTFSLAYLVLPSIYM